MDSCPAGLGELPGLDGGSPMWGRWAALDPGPVAAVVCRGVGIDRGAGVDRTLRQADQDPGQEDCQVVHSRKSSAWGLEAGLPAVRLQASLLRTACRAVSRHNTANLFERPLHRD